ncbi:MAG TPA: hypothetical protein VGL61_10150 [Kofleriaceae bacterium]
MRWLAVFLTACIVQPYPVARPVVYQQPPRQAADPSARQVARANALTDQLADADRLAAARDDERAVNRYRAVSHDADRLLAESPRADIADRVRELRDRAEQGAAAAWERFVDALVRTLHATTPAQRAVLHERGRPELSRRRGEVCWLYRGDPGDVTYCWTAAGRLANRDEASAPQARESDPPTPPAPAAPSPPSPPTPAAAAKHSKIAYYAAATFASGSCNFGNCLTSGWTTRTPDGDVNTSCEFSDCAKSGWTSQHPDGGESSTSCEFGDCFKSGWTTRHPDGTESSTSCEFGDCMKSGWTTRMPDGTESSTSCEFGDCATSGWTTRLPDGRSISCSCEFGDCLKNGASCQ